MSVVDEGEYGLSEVTNSEGIGGEGEFVVGGLEGEARDERGLRLGPLFE
jgi:hypothetical protein